LTLAISSIDEESLLVQEPILVPPHEHLKLAEIKGNTGLPYYQPPIIQESMACATFYNKDLDSCIMFEKRLLL